MSILYIVATPIGNLEDVSKRALETLSNVDLILAEDTRVTQKLLVHFGINKPVESYHQHSSLNTKYYILNTLAEGKNIALVSDAGTPGISDPGNELIDFIITNNKDIQIIPIPGASAVTAALSVCGLNVNQYMFLGFWPKKKYSKVIKTLQSMQLPFVFFESPHRIIKTLNNLLEAFGEDLSAQAGKRVYVGRELTKLHETHYRGSIKDVVLELEKEKFLKGEIVVVVE